jgi:predicted transposase YdaD
VNHDALFKMLLKRPAILKGFFEAFLPQVAQFIDFAHLQFVDKERITLDGRKRTGDLLVKTRFRETPAGFLIHLEHQAQLDSDLGRRLLEYWMLDWREYNLPVYPIAVLSYNQTGQDLHLPLEIRFPNKRVLQFDFDVIDLPRMEAHAFTRLKNPAALALAARMKVDQNRRTAMTRDFFLSLAGTAISREDQALVAGFFSSYQPLTARENLQLQLELGKVESDAVREAVMNLTNPFIELGKQRGRQEGIAEGQAELVLKQLSRRLGNLSASRARAVRKLSPPKIEALGEALLEFRSSTDLAQWLRKNK